MEKRDESPSNKDSCIQKEKEIHFQFLTMVASSVKLMLDRACPNYCDLDINKGNGKLAVLPEWWAVVQSPTGGVCQVLIQEHDLTGQLASSVRSPVALSRAQGC